MKTRLICSIALGLALTAAVSAQNANPAPPAVQAPAPGPASGNAPGLGWRAGVSGRMAETGMGGRGVAGTVTAATANYFAVKTESGLIFKVQFSANTRFLKQMVQGRGEAGESGEVAESSGRGNRQMAPPAPIKSSDIKVGDEIAVLGEVSETANFVGATVILQVDPERAKLMHERQADFGKTWLMGKVTAINETTVSILGALDNTTHDFKADANTTFRKRRAPITLADIQVGDTVRLEGAVKDGIFVAVSVAVMSMPPSETPDVPHDAPATTGPEPNTSQPGAQQPK